jgi:CDP-glucose 4,6-dehydratase
VRNPYSIRPYQHVLEPLFAYMTIAAEQYMDESKAGYYNVGPNEEDCLSTGELADQFARAWGDGIKRENMTNDGPHEANFLKLDCSKIKKTFGWRPRWNAQTAIEKVVEWEKCRLSGGDVRDCMRKQIDEFSDQ